MRSTIVGPDGSVRCPACGGTQFSDKRTVKGKIAAGVLAPKRLKCRGCGANLKKAGGDREVAVPAQRSPLVSGPRPKRDSFRRGDQS